MGTYVNAGGKETMNQANSGLTNENTTNGLLRNSDLTFLRSCTKQQEEAEVFWQKN